MICKWCGKPIKTFDSACMACGRRTSPLSDCGGFYQLKVRQCEEPEEQYTVRESTAYESVDVGEVTSVTIQERPKQKFKWLPVLLGVLLLLACTGIICQSLVLKNTKDELNKIEQALNEARTPVEPVLAKQNVMVQLQLKHEDGVEAVAGIDLGAYSDFVSMAYDVDYDEVTAEIKLEHSEESVVVVTEYDETPFSGEIAIKMMLSEKAFGAQTAFRFDWEYKNESDKEWKCIDESLFAQIDSGNGSKLSYKKLGNTLYEGKCEFRCVGVRSNNAGGTLILTVEGIEVPFQIGVDQIATMGDVKNGTDFA